MNKNSAYDYLNNILSQVGINIGNDRLHNLAKGAESFDELVLQAQTLPEWKQRFSANEARIKNGLAPLPFDQYLATESAYKQVLRAAGLPPGLFDSPADTNKWIANNVSVQEMADRVKVAEDAVNQFSPAAKKSLKEFYGIDAKHLTAWALDPKRALPQLQKMAQVAQMGGAAKDAGLGHLTGGYLTKLVEQGVSTDQAKSAFVQAKDQQSAFADMARVDGTNLKQSQLVGANLGTDAKARKKLKGMAAREAARFTGDAGATGGTFSGGGTGGAF